MIHLLSRPLADERSRQHALLPNFSNSEHRSFGLSYEDVLDVHFCIADFFKRDGYGMGGVGIKDLNTFVSTVERQFAGFDGHDVYETDYEKIATLMYGIIKNHPFHDGNKRSAFLCALLLLHKKGRAISIGEKEFEDLMVEIANDELHRKSALKKLIKRNQPNPEIRFLGRYLEKNSRKTSKLRKMLKFRELRSIIVANGFDFKNPHKGTIDLIKTEERRTPRFWLRDRIENKEMVLATIAYHGEGVDVPDGTLKLVRQKCGLTDQDGFDGEVLLRDAEPTFQLINSYRTALQSLAYR